MRAIDKDPAELRRRFEAAVVGKLAGATHLWSRAWIKAEFERQGVSVPARGKRWNRQEFKRIPLNEPWAVDDLRKFMPTKEEASASGPPLCHPHCAQCVRFIVKAAEADFKQWPSRTVMKPSES